MVRKGVVRGRIKDGIISSNNPVNDRERTVSRLFEIYSWLLPKDEKPKMINFSTHMLKEEVFSGKDPMISGIIVFMIAVERFTPKSYKYITRAEIKRDFTHFAGGDSFTNFKEELEYKFENYKPN